MNNETFLKYFYILPFSEVTKGKPLLSILFFLLYFIGVFVNYFIITVICLEVQLHKPMYLFICNLSFVDIFYTSVTTPKLLYLLLSGDHIVSFSQCYMQFYFFIAAGGVEEILLFVMAYDRYVAICIPLHYNQILSRRNCAYLVFFIWVSAFLNSLLYITLALNMSSCHSNLIHQFFCNAKTLTKSTCTTTQLFFIVDAMEMLLFVLGPLLCTVISYVNVFSVIFKMQSRESRKKSFSTCSSHIIVICIYYGTCISGYLIPSYSDALAVAFDVVYTSITPILNPIIYSLQNHNVKAALLHIFSKSCSFKHAKVKHSDQ